MNIPPLCILILFQLVNLINGTPNKCVKDYTIHRHMKLNDSHIEELTRGDGIKSVYHCQESDSFI